MKKFFALLTIAVLFTTMPVFAIEVVTDNDYYENEYEEYPSDYDEYNEDAQDEVQEEVQPFSIAGYIEYETDDSITVVSFDGQDRVILNITEETVILEADTNQPMVLRYRENDRILAYYGPITTRSIPPQSNAVMLFLHFEGDEPSDYPSTDYVDGHRDYAEEPTPVPYTPPVMTLVDALSNVYSEFYTENNITMVPLRQVAESMGFNVIWNEANRSVTLQHSDGQAFGTVMLDQDTFEGRSLEVAPTIHEGRTFVPVSFFEILLGM